MAAEARYACDWTPCISARSNFQLFLGLFLLWFKYEYVSGRSMVAHFCPSWHTQIQWSIAFGLLPLERSNMTLLVKSKKRTIEHLANTCVDKN